MKPKEPQAVLREWMIWSGMTQADMARRLGVSPAAVCRLLAGKRRPGLRTAVAIDREMRQPRDDGKAYRGRVLRVQDWGVR